jgi:hypothetical protein
VHTDGQRGLRAASHPKRGCAMNLIGRSMNASERPSLEFPKPGNVLFIEPEPSPQTINPTLSESKVHARLLRCSTGLNVWRCVFPKVK